MFDNRSDSGVKLVFCERFNETSDIWNLSWHDHPFVELIYFLDGGARIHSDSDDLILSVFDLVLYPENLAHKEDIDLSNNQEIVCLGIEFPKPSGLHRIRRLTDIDSCLRWLFVEIHAQSVSDYPQKSILVDHLVRVLLHYISQYLVDKSDEGDPISRVIHFIHENLSKRIFVEELANLANYSPSYLDRRFKDRTGMTPIQYLDDFRLNTAKSLLIRNDLNVTQVANLIGFDDPKYFSRRFTAHFGVSPSLYRESC